MNWLTTLRARSVTGLTRIACVLALVALAIMSYSVISPRPLPVIFAMSVGHLIGGTAFAFYALAVLLDVRRRGRSSLPPKADEPSSQSG